MSTSQALEETEFQNDEMEYRDPNFEKTISDLRRLFLLKRDTLELYTQQVVGICSASLAGSNIRHIPMTSRVKSWDSAEGSIRRRQKERVLRRQLCDFITKKGWEWKNYCHETRLDPREDEMAPFQTLNDMLAALHDFGGARISLYFPGDLERVDALLRERFDVLKRIDKGQGSAGNVQNLQERIDHLKSPTADKEHENCALPIAIQEQRQFTRIFSGYKATHFIVKMREEDIRFDRREGWADIVIEIQVGTLVMHSWSEVEHDMIYKPLASQGEKLSDDEERVLDLINGIVLMGESALRQLEASTAKRESERTRNENALASSHYELGVWIEKYFREKKAPLADGEWQLLEQLFVIMTAADHHKYSDVVNLLSKSAPQSKSRQTIPKAMLAALCSQSENSEWPKFEFHGSQDVQIAKNARLWALRLVYSLTLAMYLGVGEEFVGGEIRSRSQPSIVSLLNILHPSCPRYANFDDATAIVNSCKAILDMKCSPHQELSLVDVAKILPKATAVVGMAEVDGLATLLVPGMIRRLFPMDNSSSEELANPIDESEDYRVLTILQDTQLDGYEIIDALSALWEKLTVGPVDWEYRIDRSSFVAEESLDENKMGLWALVNCSMKLDFAKLDSDKMGKTVNDISPTKFRDKSDTLKGFPRLAYCLYPEAKWEDICRLSRTANAFWRAAVLYEESDKETAPRRHHSSEIKS
ncbi:hypothetical protein N7499_000010 [Penicillium canescens]|nr:hypothetical protein N7499_000010 [Penicillium canescens]KAJ6172843.1 hypothetical protein N7485_005655 [Penicillium canescens]